MFDGFSHGIFGGLFGPLIAKYLSRFRYWVIFLTTTACTYLFFFAFGVYKKGLKKAFELTFMNGFDPVFIFLPIAVGMFAMFVAYLGSLNESKEQPPTK